MHYLSALIIKSLNIDIDDPARAARVEKLVSVTRYFNLEKQMGYIFNMLGYETMWVSLPKHKISSLIFPSFFIGTGKSSGLNLIYSAGPDAYCLYSFEGLDKSKTVDLDFFEEESSVFFLFEKSKSFSQGKKIKKHSPIPVNTLLVLLLLSSISGLFFLTQTLYFALIGASSFSGIFIFYLLIKSDITGQANIISAICNSDKNASCNKVLRYRVFDHYLFDFKVLGFVYFFSLSSIFIAALLQVVVLSPTLLLPIITAGLVGVLCSLYLQVFRLRALCKICLLSAFLVLLNAVLLIPNTDYIFYFKDLLRSVFFICLSTAAVVLFYEGLKKAAFAALLESSLTYFKSEYHIFKNVLAQNNSINTVEHFGSHYFEFGSTEPEISICLIISLECPHCYRALDNMLNLVNNSIKFNLKIWFSSVKKPVDKEINFLNHMLEKRDTYDVYTFYADFSRWARLDEPTAMPLQNQEDRFIKEINVTPLIFIDGFIVPHFYDFKDVKYLLSA